MTRLEIIWLGTTIVVLGAIATVAARPAPLLVWNVTPSAPIGLYAVFQGSKPARWQMVIARMPPRWRQLAAKRNYIPANVPLVKRVAAVAGDRICAVNKTVTINGGFAARRLPRDRRGRPLPAWHGCLTLRRQELFLLNDDKDSFDGRYFGVTSAREIIGKATLLWRR